MNNASDNELFLLFSNCKIVTGFSRSLVCDLQLRKMIPIPNSLAYLFKENNALYCREIKQQLLEEELTTFESYLRFLAENELGFFCTTEELQQFPMLSTEWDYPAYITNCIIDARKEINFLDTYFTEHLDSLGCYHLQLRFYDSPGNDHLNNLLEIIRLSKIQSVELIVKSTNQHKYLQEMIMLSDKHDKLRSIIIHSHIEDLILKEFVNNHGLVVTSKGIIFSEKNCGIIDKNFFQSNIPHYTEAISFNTCLNRKISIDINGNIKNCPSMQNSFGNIKEITLLKATDHPEFKKYWRITKDEITKCKDCEFRYVCTDCRAYLENPDDIYSAPLKCGYDPYTCEWQEWSLNPLKEAAIISYRMERLSEK